MLNGDFFEIVVVLLFRGGRTVVLTKVVVLTKAVVLATAAKDSKGGRCSSSGSEDSKTDSGKDGQ